MRKIYKIIFAAFVLRIILALLAEHGDVINYYWWSKDLIEHGFLGFYERSISNAMPPTYPPVTSYIFWASGALHELIWKVAWFLNVRIPLFPSNFIFWLESPKGWYFTNKLPAIFADVGIIWLLYKFVGELRNKKTAILAASFFAFSPPFWYSSSFWGQTDSIYALPLIGAFYALHKNHKIVSVFLYTLSILTKPTGVFALPIFAIWWIKKAKLRNYYWAAIVFVVSVLLIYLPFHPDNLVPWIINFYSKSLGGELNYIVANAFNFWGLVHGFNEVVETTPFLGLPSHLVGYFIYTLVAVLAVYLIWSRTKLSTPKALFIALLFSFFAFLVLPRIHERYFYPALLLLVPLAGIDKKLRWPFFLLSGIHLVNLYHFWWVPRVEIVVEILSNRLVEQLLILFNIGVFIWLVLLFKKNYAQKLE